MTQTKIRAEQMAGVDGWTAITATGTSGTLDAPSFEISFDADMTGFIGVGDRIKLTQATVKYFIVTKVGAFGGGATIITCYGGTDYALVASGTTAITLPYFSHAKTPFGFPATPDKWTVTVTDTTPRAQATPATNTWYNLGSVSISVPIGAWDVSYQLLPYAYRLGTANKVQIEVSLTTSTGGPFTVSDSDFTVAIYGGLLSSDAELGLAVYTTKYLALATKTAYYIISRVISTNMERVDNLNSTQPLFIKARCAYL